MIRGALLMKTSFARLALATVPLVVLAIVLASCQSTEEDTPHVATSTPTTAATTTVVPKDTPSPIATPGPGVTLWRWGSVTVLIPDGTGIFANPTKGGPDVKPPDGGPVLEITRYVDGDNRSGVLVDAEDGKVLHEEVADEDRDLMQAVMKTITVSPIDRAVAPWPYNGDQPPDLPRESSNGVSYLNPSPETGLFVYGGIRDPGGAFLAIKSERSVAFVSVEPLPDDCRLIHRMFCQKISPCLSGGSAPSSCAV